MNAYADFVMQLDHHMGQLLAALDDAGLTDNTLVLFTSDNGCSPQANFDVLADHGHHPSGVYRGHKADIYEGGHRVPLIVRWPGRIEAGRKTNEVACLTDIYATLAEVHGAGGRVGGGEDSFSLMPIFQGTGTSERGTLISHSIGGSFSIRIGEWKLCVCYGSGGWSAPVEHAAKDQGLPPMQLYQLAEDPGETTNLAAANPGRVQEMLAVLRREIQSGRCTPGLALTNDRDVELPALAWSTHKD